MSVTIHPQAELALGFPNILFSTLSTRYQVNHIDCSAVSTALQSYSCPIRRLGYVGRGYHVAGSTSWSATWLAFAMRLIICGIWLQSCSHKKVSEAFGPSESHNWHLPLKKVRQMDRLSLLSYRHKPIADKAILPFVITYHPDLPKVRNIVDKRWPIIESSDHLNLVFPQKPMLL